MNCSQGPVQRCFWFSGCRQLAESGMGWVKGVEGMLELQIRNISWLDLGHAADICKDSCRLGKAPLFQALFAHKFNLLPVVCWWNDCFCLEWHNGRTRLAVPVGSSPCIDGTPPAFNMIWSMWFRVCKWVCYGGLSMWRQHVAFKIRWKVGILLISHNS